ncbi:MAG: pyridoxal phosphate-dependent aminotransferase [Halioglobus sp.]|nr:pyridoxal phosphate-dependent aminotransferase [Halioglobus sp.]
MKWPAERIANSSPKSFGMYEKTGQLIARGADLIHLEVGRPSFDTPVHIKEATKRALDDGKVHYGEFPGELKFREALADKLHRDNGIAATPEQIVVTGGLTHSAFAVCMAAVDPGDEVILLEPYYPQHINKVELAGGRIVTAPLDVDNHFSIDAEIIERYITPKTRMLALVNPANPTGRVYSREELQGLAGLAIKHDLLVMSDEVYEQIVFDDKQHISIASLPGMAERTVSMFAFTKGYAMDGWRLGYMAAPAAFISALLKITMNDMSHVNVFIQDGGYAAITATQDCVAQMVAEDQRRRDLLVERLNAMPGVRCALPEGSIYAFPNIQATGLSSQQVAEAILEQTHVVVEAGSFYGDSGEGYLRVCFGSVSYERIEEAMNRLEAFFVDLQHT